jgi:hypothetical protein
MSLHRFKVGQTVNYTPGFTGSVKADTVFRITQLMPAADDELQYRIRTASEPYEFLRHLTRLVSSRIGQS